jgi:hypothetical protein
MGNLGSNTSWPLRIMCISSMPTNTFPAAQNDLKFSIARVIRLIAQWSCSTMLFRYLICLTSIGAPLCSMTSSMAALLDPLLSIVTFSGTPLVFMPLVKNRIAAALSLWAVSKKSTVLPCLSTGRYRYFHSPLTLIRLIHAPATTYGVLVATRYFFKQRQEANRPTADAGVIHKHASLLHHFFQMSIAQRVGCISAYAHQNHFQWKSHRLAAQHGLARFIRENTWLKPAGATWLMRQNRLDQL